ncbi:MAG: PKD domain protein [Methanoregula sp. PtaU1.Bin051]|nr:MAG: PKD domain protein [Methanoregula sp. PtaU1.Bin051]
MYWEPDDWEAEESDSHAAVWLNHDGTQSGLMTILDATGGQYVEIILGAAGNEEVGVYLDSVLLGTVSGENAKARFDISGNEWTTSSELRFNAIGSQWTSSLVRSISLMASDNSGTPVADFVGIPNSGVAPLEVVFTDESTGTPTSWLWNFGDGDTSSQQNPHHTYVASGSYTVQLIVMNSAGSDAITKTDYITVAEPIEMTIEIRDDDTNNLIPNSEGGLYDYNANEWQNVTTPSGTIIFLDSGSSHQYPLVIGNTYRLAASADGYSPVMKDIAFGQSGQVITIELEKEIPVALRYSITMISDYAGTDYDGLAGAGPLIAQFVDADLSNAGWQREFLKTNSSVAKEDFGTSQSGWQGLDEATLHYHFGHGMNHIQQSWPLIPDSGIFLYHWPDQMDYLSPLDVSGKWDKTNKWVILDACEVLSDPTWGDAMVTSHGILGFESEKYANPLLPKRFFQNVIGEDQTVYNAWMDATTKLYDTDTIAAVRFDNKYQLDNDHLSGHGEVAPDEYPNDDETIYDSWQC